MSIQPHRCSTCSPTISSFMGRSSGAASDSAERVPSSCGRFARASHCGNGEWRPKRDFRRDRRAHPAVPFTPERVKAALEARTWVKGKEAGERRKEAGGRRKKI